MNSSSSAVEKTPDFDASAHVLRIATRESPLAMWQARHVAENLGRHGFATRLVPLVSVGDTDMRPIDGTRQVGLFTKRIQQALVDDEADVAVHSLKDLPTQADDRFRLAAVATRETVRDSLVSPTAMSLADLPRNAKIGTGSTRRMAQLKSLRGDLQILPIRGNVQTRLAKLHAGEFDAIVLAEAGVLRLEMHDLPRVQFSLTDMLPAPGQGALGIEVRSDDPFAIDALQRLDDRDARLAVIAERTVLAELHGGCLAPIAAHATVENMTAELPERLRLIAIVLSTDGSQRLEETAELAIPNDASLADCVSIARTLGTSVAQTLRNGGAEELIAAAR